MRYPSTRAQMLVAPPLEAEPLIAVDSPWPWVPNSTMDDLQKARLAQNEDFFREVNERINKNAESHGTDSRRYEFFCECSDVVEHAHDRNRAGRGSERPKCVAQDGDLVVRHRYHGVIREPNVDAAPLIHSDEGYKAESRFLGRLRRRRAAEKAF